MRALIYLAALAAAGAATASSHAAAPAPSPSPASAPAVTVKLDNSATSVTEGSDVSYRITVRNNSDVDYPHALITHMLPPALRFGAANPAVSESNESTLEGVHTAELQWTRHLAPYGEISIDIRTVIAQPANSKTTVTTTACVLPDGTTRPLICDSDSDVFVKAGGHGFTWWLIAIGLAVGGAFGAHRWLKKKQRDNVRKSQADAPAQRADKLRDARPYADSSP